MGWLILIGLVLGAWSRALPGPPDEPTPYLLVPLATLVGGVASPFAMGLTGHAAPGGAPLVTGAVCGTLAAAAVKLGHRRSS